MLAYDLDHVFKYHRPSKAQAEKYTKIRNAAKRFAVVVAKNTPAGSDQSDAIRKIREAVMTANAGIALGGRSYRKAKATKR